MYSADAALDAFSLVEYPNVYFIGPYAERVSFASQQRRALNLVWALNVKESLAGKLVGVIGAGLAGLTATAAAITCGADVSLFEMEHEICSMQRETDRRYVHPSINFWPQEPLEPITSWPFLNWYAAPCRDVIAEISRQWTQFLSTIRMEERKKVERVDAHRKLTISAR